jgi:hypothetical protein
MIELKCKICDKFYETTPIVLPCGITVCDYHLKNGQLKDECVSCYGSHAIDTDYIILREVEMKMKENSLMQRLYQLKTNLNDFKTIKESPFNYMLNFYSKIKNEISMGVELAIRNAYSQKNFMLKKIDETIDRFRTQSDSLTQFESINLNEYENFVQYQCENLKNEYEKLRFDEAETLFKDLNDKITDIEIKIRVSLDEYLKKNPINLNTNYIESIKINCAEPRLCCECKKVIEKGRDINKDTFQPTTLNGKNFFFIKSHGFY